MTINSCSILKSDDSDDDIVQLLQALDGIIVTELQSSDPQQRLFQIDMEQPVDHSNPDGQTFTQRLYLHHPLDQLNF